jgi:hypothetical protein
MYAIHSRCVFDNIGGGARYNARVTDIPQKISGAPRYKLEKDLARIDL